VGRGYVGHALLCRFGLHPGLVKVRQTFVRRCHGGNCSGRGSRMSNESALALNSEQDLASIPIGAKLLATCVSSASCAERCTWKCGRPITPPGFRWSVSARLAV